MRRPSSLSGAVSRRRFADRTLPLLLALLCASLLAVPGARALAEEPSPEGGAGFGNLADLIEEVTPGAVITHEKGNAVWSTNENPTPELSDVTGTRGRWTDWEPGYWTNSFTVVGSQDVRPEYTARIPHAISWIDPETGVARDMDFEVHYRAVELIPDAPRVEVQQRMVNGFYTYGIRKSQVTYRIYPTGSDRPLNPGRFVYWCRSLNPGERVAFSQAANPGVRLERAYLTNKGLYDKPYANAAAAQTNGHWGDSSVIVGTEDGGETITFTGSPSLRCHEGYVLDVSDEGERIDEVGHHVWGAPQSAPGPHQSLFVHGDEIPFEDYIEFRAVTFDVGLDSAEDAGLTLDYYTNNEFYWEMQFNGILTTRKAPVKTVPSGSETDAGETVTFAVTQSLDQIPKGLLSTLVFEDRLPEGLTYVSASMAVDGETLPEDAGTLAVRDGLLTYTFARETLDGLDCSDESSDCVLTIEMKVPANAAEGSTYANRAKVTMNEDEADSNEVTVAIPRSEPPSVEVEQPKGVLTIDKRAVTLTHDGKARVGEPVTYDILVQNVSGSAVKDVVVTDALPKGLVLTDTPRLTDDEFRDLSVADCTYWVEPKLVDGSIVQGRSGSAGGSSSYESGPNVWDGKVRVGIDRLGPGTRVHVLVKTAVTLDAPAEIVNVATLDATDHDHVKDEATIEVVRPIGGGDSGEGGDGNGGGSGGGTESGSGGDSGGEDGKDPNGGTGGTTDGGAPGDKDPGGPSGSEDPGGKDPSGSSGGKDPDDPSDGDGSGSGDPDEDQDGDGPDNPSDADGPSSSDPDNAGGDSGDRQPDGSSDPNGVGGGDGSGGGTGANGGTGVDGNGGSYGTGTNGANGTVTPSPVPSGTYGTSPVTTADASQQDASAKAGKRLLPQTDAPPLIAIATSGGIGMTGALVIHSLWSAWNRRR